MEFLEKFWIYPAISLTAIIGMSILATGKHESYYFQQESASTSIVYYCLYADVNWRTDPSIFCSEDISKVLMLTMAMNAQKNSGVQLPQAPTPKTQTQ